MCTTNMVNIMYVDAKAHYDYQYTIQLFHITHFGQMTS